MLLPILSKFWWTLLLRGILTVLFGLAALIWPGITLAVLVILFGAFVVVDGIFAMMTAIQAARQKVRWWPFLLEGLAAMGVGVLTFLWPSVTAMMLVFLISAWAMVTGLFRVIVAIRLRHEITGEWLLALSGLVAMVFGVLLFFFPGEGALALVVLIGAYALLLGLLMVLLSFRLRGLRRRIDEIRARMSET